MANFFFDNKNLEFHLHHPLMKKIVPLKEANYRDYGIYDDAPADYEDCMDSYEKVLEIIGEICGEIIAPNADDVDKEGPVVENGRVIYAKGTAQNHEALTKAGVVGMALPRKFKGLNFSMVPYVMAAELVSRADAGFANIWGLQDCGETLLEFASDDIKNKYLPMFNEGATASMDLTEPDAGSDLQAVRLKAHFDEKSQQWLLNGVKRFITNGDAEIALVLARSEEGTVDGRGLSLFVYDKNDNAVTVRRIEHKLGIVGSPTCELVFHNAPAQLVGERKLGLIKYVMSLMNGARLGVAAQSVGIAEAAYREAVKYASERKQFGKLINSFPAVYEMLKMMQVNIFAIRSLLYETTRFVDMYKCYQFLAEERKLEKEEISDQKKYNRLADVFTPLVKLVSSEYANQIAYDSLQIHGGTGYMKDFPIERIYRDARITSIYEGTTQLQVVAAIRGVNTGTFLSQINEYASIEVKPEHEYLKFHLEEMTQTFREAQEKVNSAGNLEFLDFHARRLVEMCGNIIMGYLLLHDAERDKEYSLAAEIFILDAQSKNRMKANIISSFDMPLANKFKQL
ncbi:MAG: acyl-CoA dehydrogenase family protein [Bacteroidales bacterium]|nr:acyl-CoA dehydrogenase family protein [Bacteroidales bacterium]HOY39510.1 acyl-CoA dehydrogenase family protein [Bacteroidales bacterium]HQP05092.1 acyl-CoA dehydrogenase family protein [Bacteroidales bacterium]